MGVGGDLKTIVDTLMYIPNAMVLHKITITIRGLHTQLDEPTQIHQKSRKLLSQRIRKRSTSSTNRPMASPTLGCGADKYKRTVLSLSLINKTTLNKQLW